MKMRQIADSVGLTIPASLDMTLKQAQRDARCFSNTPAEASSSHRAGEIYFKKAYQIDEGREAAR